MQTPGDGDSYRFYLIVFNGITGYQSPDLVDHRKPDLRILAVERGLLILSLMMRELFSESVVLLQQDS